jgi:glycine cleavage system H lipoate-binding protein
MKTIKLLIISVLMLTIGFFSLNVIGAEKNPGPESALKIFCPPELYNLSSQWANAYRLANPGKSIDVEMSSADIQSLAQSSNLVFTMNGDLHGKVPVWIMTVGREVIVPVFSTENPSMKEINSRGVSKEFLIQLIQDPGGVTWGGVLNQSQPAPAHIYVSNDKLVLESLQQFLGREIPAGVIVEDSKLLTDIRNDANAIGFCRLTSVLDIAANKMAQGISLLPIDKNNNGKLDYIENFYGEPNEFLRAVWIGKYPKDLTNEIYAASSSRPSGVTEIAFLKWVITDGQKYLAKSGWNGLVYSEVQSKMDRLDESLAQATPVREGYSRSRLAIFVLVALAVLGIMIGAVAGYGRGRKQSKLTPAIDMSPGFDDHTVIAPKGLFFDKTHTWAFMEKDGAVRIGMDDFLQHVTGPFTRILVKNPGEKIRKGEVLISVAQKGKQLNIYSPVSGTILESNPALEENPSLVNASPYQDGWVYRVEPANWIKEIPLMNMAEKYSRWLGDEIVRLKDVLAGSLRLHDIEYVKIILQDGGLLKNHLLEEFGPEVWEDFQTKFLDSNK